MTYLFTAHKNNARKALQTYSTQQCDRLVCHIIVLPPAMLLLWNLINYHTIITTPVQHLSGRKYIGGLFWKGGEIFAGKYRGEIVQGGRPDPHAGLQVCKCSGCDFEPQIKSILTFGEFGPYVGFLS